MEILEHTKSMNVSLDVVGLELFCYSMAWGRLFGSRHGGKFGGSVEVLNPAGRTIHWLDSSVVEICKRLGSCSFFRISIPIPMALVSSPASESTRLNHGKHI